MPRRPARPNRPSGASDRRRRSRRGRPECGAPRRGPRARDQGALRALSPGEARWRSAGVPDAMVASLVEHGEAVEAFRLVHVGRAHEDGRPPVDHVVDDEPEVASRDRIDPEGRFVEQQDLRLMDQRAREPELLLHPAGEASGEPVLERREIREAEESLEPRRPVAAAERGRDRRRRAMFSITVRSA